MLERHYAGYHQRLATHFASGEGNYRDRVLNYYQETLNQFCQQGIISGCLTVKLSAEVCDLSEDMRSAMDKGARGVIALLAQALEKAATKNAGLYRRPLNAVSGALFPVVRGQPAGKISRSALPLESALAHVKTALLRPAYNGRFYLLYY